LCSTSDCPGGPQSPRAGTTPFDWSILPDAPGTYVLILYLSVAERFRVGAAGEHSFRAGYYVYVGSALGGLRRRLARYVGGKRRTRWHVDYLLNHMVVREIWYQTGSERLECVWARALSRAPGISPFGRLGASDCRCATHVFLAVGYPHPGDLLGGVLVADVECMPVSGA